MNQFINQPVVNWVRQSLSQTVEVKLKVRFSIVFFFCFALFAIPFLSIPLWFYASAISVYLSEGWNLKVSLGLFGGTIFLVIFGALAFGTFFLMRLLRWSFVRFLSAEGVETFSGKRFGWQDLHFLNYKKVSTRVSGNNLEASIAVPALYAGIKKVIVDMIFANGKAVIPHFIENQPEILALLNSMPVQRRIEGKIIQ